MAVESTHIPVVLLTKPDIESPCSGPGVSLKSNHGMLLPTVAVWKPPRNPWSWAKTILAERPSIARNAKVIAANSSTTLPVFFIASSPCGTLVNLPGGPSFPGDVSTSPLIHRHLLFVAFCLLHVAKDKPRASPRDIGRKYQKPHDHVGEHQDDQQHTHLVMEQHRRESPWREPSDDHRECRKHRCSRSSEGSCYCLFQRLAFH